MGEKPSFSHESEPVEVTEEDKQYAIFYLKFSAKIQKAGEKPAEQAHARQFDDMAKEIENGEFNYPSAIKDFATKGRRLKGENQEVG